MFVHAYSGYVAHGFPADELRPLVYSVLNSLRIPQLVEEEEEAEVGSAEAARGTLDHAFGGFPLTLLDAMDTLAVMGAWDSYVDALWAFVDATPAFDTKVDVNVFELTIRGLGALLGNHLLLEPLDSDLASPVPAAALAAHPSGRAYRGELLALAVDLADRLLPAFDTPTGIPRSMVNLGVAKPAAAFPSETCTAGAGTLTLEFVVLSRVTGDARYEEAVIKALVALHGARSHLGLMGNTIDVNTGRWSRSDSSIGAGIDSFFEYLLKAHVVTGEAWYADMFDSAAAAVESHMHRGVFYRVAEMNTGRVIRASISSLGAFWPTVLTLDGQLAAAQNAFEGFYALWRKFGFLPEVVALTDGGAISPTSPHYPLRPELIESAYYLYRATRDPYYLAVGADVLHAIATHCKTRCGYAGVADVRTRRLDDRMDSYFLAETLKYLYLLFDVNETSFVHNTTAASFPPGGYIFTTEAHLLPVSQAVHAAAPQPAAHTASYVVRLAAPDIAPWITSLSTHPRRRSSAPQPQGVPRTCSTDEWRTAADPYGPSPYAAEARALADTAVGLTSPEFAPEAWAEGGTSLEAAAAAAAAVAAAAAAALPDELELTQAPPGPAAADLGANVAVLYLYTKTSSGWRRTELDMAETGLGIASEPGRAGMVVHTVDGKPVDSPDIHLVMLTNPPANDRDHGYCVDTAPVVLAVDGSGDELPPQEYAAAPALFGPRVPEEGVHAPMVLASSLACIRIPRTTTSYAGRIVLVSRGGCTFADKVANLAAAGATAVVVANHGSGDVSPDVVFKMIGSGYRAADLVPALMVSRSVGNILRSRIRDRETSHQPPLVGALWALPSSAGQVVDANLLSYSDEPVVNIRVFWHGVELDDIPQLIAHQSRPPRPVTPRLEK
ncbi:mannosyl-oligosaccharide 1,2-alpha-mannosidase IB [Thecamonas trahens ATCC 50062]|uniref:alpha-1,2-Mannosidase n=1 Tax=Thecamonas trahens ATCC 50062 TaxID=461836 RepID=A0A0L0DM25_THETB|nr:mannosyl-oligosaccharide 1,2-alpha-mannosidase IB [Thecamonas trahens ATCC 50062]KNC53374.1 mannosyl-oligosaccharide 1,2-alpha-mannosidase IB [Thecamonas trahens ATCC 50062]|eukprot:XP_013754419.1 mannosyl-oligosaccharide 1,2-alpha-mannosidase IB [Thecamonas trahens ATCC 50062]